MSLAGRRHREKDLGLYVVGSEFEKDKPHGLDGNDVGSHGSFRKLGVPYLGVLIIRILLFRGTIFGSPYCRKHPHECNQQGPQRALYWRNMPGPVGKLHIGFRLYGFRCFSPMST